MERDLRPFVRPVSKGRFLNVTCLCVENLANLKLETAVVQQRRLRGLILYLPAAIIPLYIYNKVYTPRRCTLFAYIGVWECYGRSVCIYIDWRGQASRCLSFSRGNARAFTQG